MKSLPDKLYYSIGEVADAFEVNTSLIRYWEDQFDVIRPKRNKKGDRFFTAEDIKNLRLIYRLVKVQGHTLEGARQKLKEDKGEMRRYLEVIDSLTAIKNELETLRDNL